MQWWSNIYSLETQVLIKYFLRMWLVWTCLLSITFSLVCCYPAPKMGFWDIKNNDAIHRGRKALRLMNRVLNWKSGSWFIWMAQLLCICCSVFNMKKTVVNYGIELWSWNLFSLFISYANLGKLLKLSKLLFPHMWNESDDRHPYFTGNWETPRR